MRSILISGTASYPAFTDDLLGRFVHRQEAITPERVAAYQLPMRRFSYGADIGDWAYAFAGAGCEASASLDPLRLTAWSRNGPPVVLVWGTADTITPIAQARSLMRWMPEAKLVELPDVGHIPHIEDPAKFATALLGAVGPAEPPVRPSSAACQARATQGPSTMTLHRSPAPLDPRPAARRLRRGRRPDRLARAADHDDRAVPARRRRRHRRAAGRRGARRAS